MNSPFAFGDGRDWFLEAQFGLFVHWGIYAIPGWHEQHIYRKRLSRVEYSTLAASFNPRKFDPDEWLDAAQAAGMRYICFTAKHIDGFCMWDSDLTDFKVTATPYDRDVLGMLADACHRRSFPLCLYYSVVDGHQPNYPHAGRSYEFAEPQPGDEPDLSRYVEFMKGQIRELCTRYGKIHGWWWDGNVLRLADPSLNALVRELQPGIIINNRGPDEGDFGTPERDWDDSVTSDLRFARPVEACQAIGYQSWGWRLDEDYYSFDHLVGSIQNMLAKGGNYLLNVGPKASGTFPRVARHTLAHIGAWFSSVREAFAEAEPANELVHDHSVLLTRRRNTLYVHVFKQPPMGAIYLHPITALPVRATVLNTGKSVRVDVTDLPWLHAESPDRALRISNLPVDSRSLVGWVIRLEFEGDVI